MHPRQLVAGELFLNETIPRLVRIQRADHVIAIMPGVRAQGVRFGETVGIGIARDIEPVPRPAFPIRG